MLCNKCGFKGTPNLEKTGPHTNAMCKRCGSYIKMITKEELATILSTKPKPKGSMLTVKTTAPRTFLGTIMKQVDIAIMRGYESGEGELERFLSDTPYTYSYLYSEDE